MIDNEKGMEHGMRREAHNGGMDINDRLIIHLRDLSHMMRAMYEGKGSQKRVLIVLYELGGSTTQRELTERLGIQPGSASEVIAKLESTGCIQRTPNENDRRTVDVALTDTGKALALEAREQRMRRHAQMFSCLSDNEKEQLLSLLEKVNGDWKNRIPMKEDSIRDGHHRRGHRHSWEE